MRSHEEIAVKRRLVRHVRCERPGAKGTVHILMENVPDTRYIQDLMPEFKAQTGIDVEIESISYIDMHSKLVPQLSSPEGGYDAIVVDFYWVAEFTQAGWLMPLDDLDQEGQCRHQRLCAEPHESRRQGERHDLHAALLQLLDGHHLSKGSARRSQGAGGLQGQIRHGSEDPDDLG